MYDKNPQKSKNYKKNLKNRKFCIKCKKKTDNFDKMWNNNIHIMVEILLMDIVMKIKVMGDQW